MQKKICSFFVLICSFVGLFIYLNIEELHAKEDGKIMMVNLISSEEGCTILGENAETSNIPEITLDGAKIAYDKNEKMFLIPQNMEAPDFEGDLSVLGGTLYFLEDEMFSDKATAIRENHTFTLFWVNKEDVSLYKVVFTGMPVMNLTSDSGSVWLYDPYHENAQFQQDTCTYHTRGASSAFYPKKSYKLNLKHDVSFLGMRSDDDWILNALYDDEGLIHNRLSYLVWQEIASSNHVENDESISMEYVELFVDNQYCGVYGLQERVDKKQLELGKKDILYKYRSWAFPEGTDYYLSGEETENSPVTLKYPKNFQYEDWNPMRDWIALFRHLEESNYDVAKNFLDMENAIDYELFLSLSCAMDNSYKNTYFVAKYQTDGCYQMVEIPWDLNNTWGNYWVEISECRSTQFQERWITYENMVSLEFFSMFAVNPSEISELLFARWKELRKKVVTTEHIEEILNREFSYLHDSGAYARNEATWPPTCEHWSEDLIYQYVEGRIAYLDSYYERIYEENHG